MINKILIKKYIHIKEDEKTILIIIIKSQILIKINKDVL